MASVVRQPKKVYCEMNSNNSPTNVWTLLYRVNVITLRDVRFVSVRVLCSCDAAEMFVYQLLSNGQQAADTPRDPPRQTFHLWSWPVTFQTRPWPYWLNLALFCADRRHIYHASSFIARLRRIKLKLNSMVWVSERTIPTEWPPFVGEVIANFCG
jgi:hypothetical protein